MAYQMAYFLGNWDDEEDLKNDFWPKYEESYQGQLAKAKILLASYGTPSYEGYAFVLFQEGGKLFEINASHCSCMGLEGQWEPEETTVADLRHRITEGNLGSGGYDQNPFAVELSRVLDALDPAIGYIP